MFGIEIVNTDKHNTKRVHHGNHEYIIGKSGSKFSLCLHNRSEQPCDTEVYITNRKMGEWRLNSHRKITIERSSYTSNCFEFYGLDIDNDLLPPEKCESTSIVVIFKPCLPHIQVKTYLYHSNGNDIVAFNDDEIDHKNIHKIIIPIYVHNQERFFG